MGGGSSDVRAAFSLAAAAAAAEENDECYNDDPGTVIIKKMAKTIVIHNVFLRFFVGIALRYHTMRRNKMCAAFIQNHLSQTEEFFRL